MHTHRHFVRRARDTTSATAVRFDQSGNNGFLDWLDDLVWRAAVAGTIILLGMNEPEGTT